MLVKIYTYCTIKSVRPAEGLGLYVLSSEIQGKEVTLSGAILFKDEPKEGEEKSASAKVADLIVNLSAIKRLTNSCDELELYTDSSWFAAGWECGWLDKWKSGGWKNSKGEPIAHAKYWQEIDEKLSGLNVRPRIHIMERHPWSTWFESEEKLFREGRFVWTK